MADQTNDDTKAPLARRGARPYGGPPTASAPSRPFVRPATAQRPTAAPFVAPVVPGKLVLRNAAPAAPAAKPPTPVAPPPVLSTGTDATALSARPAPSEMAALDAIDAFDAVWGVAEPSSRPLESGPVASPLDEISLGGGTDGQQPWAADITANDIPAAESEAVREPVAFESSDAEATSTTPAWLEDDTALPAEPTRSPAEPEIAAAVDDVQPLPAVVQPVTNVGGGYALGEWTDSHTIPAFDEIMGTLPELPVAPVLEPLGDAPQAAAGWAGDAAPDSPEPAARFELVEGNREPQLEVNREEPQPAVVTAALTAEAYSPHEARIAAMFDRLADRVRSGEIDVSSIAPEATDAAVLASVLAALLGGSRSR